MQPESHTVAWGMTLALAIGTDIVAAREPSGLQWTLFIALLIPAAVPFVWRRSRAMRPYAAVLFLQTLLAVFFWNRLPGWASAQAWFPQDRGGAAFALQLPKAIAALLMIGAVAGLGFKRREYFLTGGDGMSPWLRRAGWAAALITALAALYLHAFPAGGNMRYVPLALLLAGMNAFAEEVLYRGVLLAPLLRCVGSNQAILITATLFGIAHYYGTPSGVPGIALTFIAGWIFGQAMVSTRGLALPWVLHFIPDAVIYVSSI